MRGFSFFILIFAFHFSLVGQDQKSGVLVLKDGRMVAIQGEYQVYGDEVQFTSSQGELMTLPTSKINFEETDRRNELIDSGKASELASSDPSKGPVIYIPPPKPQEQEAQPEEKSSPKSVARVFDNIRNASDRATSLQPEMGYAYEGYGEVIDALGEGLGPWFQTFFYIAIGLICLSALAHVLTRIWILVQAWQESAFWFLTIIGLSVVSVGVNIVYDPMLGSLLDVLALLSVILFIMLHCHGKRLTMLFLYTAPLWMTFLLGITFALMTVFLG